jgi:hypothetical protein
VAANAAARTNDDYNIPSARIEAIPDDPRCEGMGGRRDDSALPAGAARRFDMPMLLRFAQTSLAVELLVETFGELTERGRRSAQLPVLLLQPRDLRLTLRQALKTIIVAHIVVTTPLRLTRIATSDVPAERS